MAIRIKDLPRFQKDCIDYQTRIDAITNETTKKQALEMYNILIEAVNAVDSSVENLVESGPVFGNEHQLLRENLASVRLDLVRWLKKHSPMEETNPINLK
jgi:hypothetical protein